MLVGVYELCAEDRRTFAIVLSPGNLGNLLLFNYAYTHNTVTICIHSRLREVCLKSQFRRHNNKKTHIHTQQIESCTKPEHLSIPQKFSFFPFSRGENVSRRIEKSKANKINWFSRSSAFFVYFFCLSLSLSPAPHRRHSVFGETSTKNDVRRRYFYF